MSVTYSLDDGIARITLDDGKANALSHELMDGVDAELDRAEKEARAIVIAGREARLSAGFHLGTMTAGHEAMVGLVMKGAHLMTRLFACPKPVVVACTGHAIAAGAILLLTGDQRLVSSGAFKITFNEVAIGITPPIFLVEIARHRLSKRYMTRAITQAEVFDPEGACAAGFADRVVPPDQLVDEAIAEARRLAQLPADAFAGSKRLERGVIERLIRETLDDDSKAWGQPTPAG